MNFFALTMRCRVFSLTSSIIWESRMFSSKSLLLWMQCISSSRGYCALFHYLLGLLLTDLKSSLWSNISVQIPDRRTTNKCPQRRYIRLWSCRELVLCCTDNPERLRNTGSAVGTIEQRRGDRYRPPVTRLQGVHRSIPIRGTPLGEWFPRSTFVLT